jgi:hypothetical protein
MGLLFKPKEEILNMSLANDHALKNRWQEGDACNILLNSHNSD